MTRLRHGLWGLGLCGVDNWVGGVEYVFSLFLGSVVTDLVVNVKERPWGFVPILCLFLTGFDGGGVEGFLGLGLVLPLSLMLLWLSALANVLWFLFRSRLVDGVELVYGPGRGS